MTLLALLSCALCTNGWSDTTSGEIGVEWDTNIHRTETVNGLRGGLPIRQMALMRLGLRTHGERLAKGLGFQWDGYAGGKFFFGEEGQRENVGIVSVSGQVSKKLQDDKPLIGLSLSHYDAFGFDPFSVGLEFSGRNFRSTRLGAFASLNLGTRSSFTLRADGSRFEFKSNSDFDWWGGAVGADLRSRIWTGHVDPNEEQTTSSIDTALSYNVSRRSFGSDAFINSCSDGDDSQNCLLLSEQSRRDLAHQLTASLSYTGRRLAHVRYVLAVNDSNSRGFGQTRHRIELGGTTPLTESVFLTLKGTVRLNFFHSTLRLAPSVNSQGFVSVDEENRNSLTALVSQYIGERLALEVRYSLFSNEIASDEQRFRRQTFYAGLNWQLD